MGRTVSPKSPKASASKGKYADVMWVNYSLTKADREALKKAVWTLEDLEDCLIKLTESNYKVSVQWDDRQDCYSCFIITRDSEHENAGYICTGRGSTPHKAIKQAYYIGFHILEGVFSNVNQYSDKGELDD